MALDEHDMKAKQQAEQHSQHIFHQQHLDAEQAFMKGLLRMYLNQKERVEQLLPVRQLMEKCILADKHQLEEARLEEQSRQSESWHFNQDGRK